MQSVLFRVDFLRKSKIPRPAFSLQAVCANHLGDLKRKLVSTFFLLYRVTDYGKDIQLLDGSVSAFILKNRYWCLCFHL